MKTAGILLAGGESRRFGSPKAFAQKDSRYFYEWAYDALASVSEQVVIVAHPNIVDRFKSDVTVIVDDVQYAGKGPLAGLYTAMQHTTAQRYMVLPCDMPYITADVCKEVMNEAVDHEGVCAVQFNGQAHPLVSCWNAGMLNDISHALIHDQLGVMKLLSRVNTTWLDGEQLTAEAKTVFCNVNQLDQWMNQG